ncbi:MAG TPA: site-2 protease family protein [Candidatus Binataceae bacterium]|nr:site-2 protease family protein [Candidatus Binataceae bacterium]
MASKVRGEFNLFRVAGVQIAIDFSWLIIFVLVLWGLSSGYFPALHPGYPTSEYWLVGIVGTILFFASIVVHELSHATVGNLLGQPVDRISLFIFGGMAHLGHEPTDPTAELKIAVAGPVTSIVLGLVFLWIAQLIGPTGAYPMWSSVFQYLGFINIALALFNLLPGFPLDGGRIVRAIEWRRTGDFRRATARAADWGRGIAYGLIALGAFEIFTGSLMGGLWLIFIALFLKGAASSSYQSIVMEQVLGNGHVSEIMVHNPETVDAGATVADAINQHFMHHGYGGFPVLSDGAPAGMVSLRQVRDCLPEERAIRKVGEVMRKREPAIEIAPSATISQALRQMSDSDIGRLLVIQQDRLAGLITRSAIARYVMLRSQLGFTNPHAVAQPPPAPIGTTTSTIPPSASATG